MLKKLSIANYYFEVNNAYIHIICKMHVRAFITARKFKRNFNHLSHSFSLKTESPECLAKKQNCNVIFSEIF